MGIADNKEYRLLSALSFKMLLNVYVFYWTVMVSIRQINQGEGAKWILCVTLQSKKSWLNLLFCCITNNYLHCKLHNTAEIKTYLCYIIKFVPPITRSSVMFWKWKRQNDFSLTGLRGHKSEICDQYPGQQHAELQELFFCSLSQHRKGKVSYCDLYPVIVLTHSQVIYMSSRLLQGSMTVRSVWCT